jgi:hypothetical protein
MKAQKFVLSAIALVVAVGGALAFRAKSNIIQLYTLNGSCNNTGYFTSGNTAKTVVFGSKQLYTAGVCTTAHKISPAFVTLNSD